jgi:hypothetical protein
MQVVWRWMVGLRVGGPLNFRPSPCHSTSTPSPDKSGKFTMLGTVETWPTAESHSLPLAAATVDSGGQLTPGRRRDSTTAAWQLLHRHRNAVRPRLLPMYGPSRRQDGVARLAGSLFLRHDYISMIRTGRCGRAGSAFIRTPCSTSTSMMQRTPALCPQQSRAGSFVQVQTKL